LSTYKYFLAASFKFSNILLYNGVFFIFQLYNSGGWDGLKKAVRASPKCDEKSIVTSLLQELRSRLALDLASEPTFERGFRTPKSEKRQVDYMVIGSSNAHRTSMGLNRMGFSSVCVHSRGWRATSGSVAALLAQVKEMLGINTSETVVIQLLDNSIFFGKTDEGALMPASRGQDGRLHIKGDLEVAGKERQMEVLNMLKPLLDLLRDKKIILVAPMPRYVAAGCCDEREHVSNRFQRGFKDLIDEKLAGVKLNMKNFLFVNGYRQAVVLDPAVDLT
jgi:hypothetical protein